MASVEQLAALMDFMEVHKELALGRLTRSKEGRSETKRLWNNCATVLNSVSADCVNKTPDQWRLYFNEYKSKLIKKIKAEKAEIGATGGGPSKKFVLTPLQERLYTILGRDIGEPLPGVRHNPLLQQNHNLEAEVVAVGDNNDPPIIRLLSEELQDLIEQQPYEEVVEFEVPAANPGTSRQHEVPDPINSRWQGLPPREATPAAPRRRRRRRRSSPNRLTEEQTSMQEASERLENMERMSAEATRELAQATHRLAAALEVIGQRLGRSPPRRVKRGRLISLSDSDN